ncbi:hypothetical protein D3C76_1198430 [compost metagenome]
MNVLAAPAEFQHLIRGLLHHFLKIRELVRQQGYISAALFTDRSRFRRQLLHFLRIPGYITDMPVRYRNCLRNFTYAAGLVFNAFGNLLESDCYFIGYSSGHFYLHLESAGKIIKSVHCGLHPFQQETHLLPCGGNLLPLLFAVTLKLLIQERNYKEHDTNDEIQS